MIVFFNLKPVIYSPHKINVATSVFSYNPIYLTSAYSITNVFSLNTTISGEDQKNGHCEQNEWI
jgi:hypothetical protein